MNVHLKRWLAVSGTALVIAAGVVAGGSYWRLESNLQTVDLAKEITHPRPPSTPGRPLNILLVGKDDGRSDTAMVVQLNAAGDQARVVSIPRDTMVPRPRCGASPPVAIAMFNSAFSTGGAACTVATVEQMSGIRIDHFVQIDFNGFRDLIDRLGGIDVTMPEAIDDEKSGLHVPAGPTKLDGTQALAFVRTRYSIGDGSDLNRIKNQQLFMRALSEKMANENWLASPAKTLELADVLTKSIVTDTGIGSIPKLADLAGKLTALKPESIAYVTLPTETYLPDPNRVQPKQPEADALWQAA
ncbi:LCP family protein [Lentzea flaviverrucosa]|uniref:Transcriptional attenuator, LytR family n=1 Tax=Lentzea flaviverrucosa TaxID=200379 RepID=A0A1H9M2V3_9PSEU|nr:LCP family protein [Lentzea flaviverrucosa]RDI31096.1 LytR family transcriptional attenuator [Lentzea flaviverrucosa]SER17991.1 transcriptional attenuator, LytR family [Lentzea flaviverrucosa]